MKTSKQSNLFLLAIVFAITSDGQAINPGAAISPQGPPALPTFIEDINGRAYVQRLPEDVEGSPFLFDEWMKGVVYFSNGLFAKNIELRFNVHKNLLYFKRNDETLEFVNPVDEFELHSVSGADTVKYIFRNGYPAMNEHTKLSFYQVLADGHVQLLKYKDKKIVTTKAYNLPDKKVMEESEDLYLYASKENKLIKLPKKKARITDEIEQQLAGAAEIIKKEKVSLSDEKSLVTFVNRLNQN